MNKNHDYTLPASILGSVIILAATLIYGSNRKAPELKGSAPIESHASSEIPVEWGDLGKRMIEAGVIDKDKLAELYASRGGLNKDDQALLDETVKDPMKVTAENSGTLLNLFWALGLGNKNRILEEGEMMNLAYGGADRFASTGGWPLAHGNAMDHYSMHQFVVLTDGEQMLVDRVSKNIYRPCCNNSTHFPDCNHGMAMLGLLELMASQGRTEAEIYKVALTLNSYWFPEQYAVIARYITSQGRNSQSVNPKEILGTEYTSISGFRHVQSLVPLKTRQDHTGGVGCGA